MLQFNILSGKKAGTFWVARRFPVRIGRAATADLRLEDEAVWDQHAQIDLDRSEGLMLRAPSEAVVYVNGQNTREAGLRNGDSIGLGSVKLQCWLASTRQRNFRFREWLTWVAIGAICLGQVWLIYWLLR